MIWLVCCGLWSGSCAPLPETPLVLLRLDPAQRERFLQRLNTQPLILVPQERLQGATTSVPNHDGQRPLETDTLVPPDLRDPLHVVTPSVLQLPKVKDCAGGPPRLTSRSSRGENVL